MKGCYDTKAILVDIGTYGLNTIGVFLVDDLNYFLLKNTFPRVLDCITSRSHPAMDGL